MIASSMMLTGCYATMPISETATTEMSTGTTTEATSDSTESPTEDPAEPQQTLSTTAADTEAGDALFRQAQNSGDYLSDGIYKKHMLCGAIPTSSAPSVARDAKGTDYVYVCRYAADETENETEGSPETYAVVIVSAYTDGTLRGASVLHSDIETYLDADEEGLAGGWAISSGTDIDEELSPILETALADYPGYTVSGVLSSQVVSGMNYRVLCTYYTDEGEIQYAIGTVYVDLEDNASLTELVSVSDGTDLLLQYIQ